MPRLRQPEQTLHIQTAQYLDMALPSDAWWTTIPAAGSSRVRGTFLKAMGYRKGTLDILIVYRGLAHWLELKSEAGRLKPEQKACIADLQRAGCQRVAVCKSLDDIAGTLAGWGIPCRAKIAA